MASGYFQNRYQPAQATSSSSVASVPNIQMPAIPQAPPDVGDARAPNSAERAFQTQRLGMLDSKYAPQMQGARNVAQQRLAGFGGYQFGQDDPSTPQDESLEIKFNPQSGPGQRQVTAIKQQRSGSNQAGMLHSSFH